ncbi:Membrane-bound lytic murein transglycosylase B [Candidatus Propionivibrio aalborgensis]|uniref:Membrane-bound lytic murein transglycosylase B n=1 Tax=Candidatus Propionivibrio aalborgensis TaxID=1860101 RepID=A0A1A8XJ19_9RHOO|nr:Membrane-bound lytic murein transglycosylase B [Candidatus Propionivibrio aalborgensis]
MHAESGPSGEAAAVFKEKQELRKTFTTLLLVLLAGLMPLQSHAAKKNAPRTPPFSEAPEVRVFILDMHERHGFDVDHLTRQFGAIHSNAIVLRAIRPAAVPEMQRSWLRYRQRFVNERRISNGLRFWQENGAELARAEAIYGVPPEIITAIIGVETEYGRNMGKFSVLEALATLAFDYPPRAEFFRNELEQFLLMARENGVSPLEIKGSYAGAIGIPQFMPSSQRHYAVDFDGDDRIDLRQSTTDSIGSVARFLNMHGWQAKAPIAVPATVEGDPTALINAGIKPVLPLKDLLEHGVTARGDDERPAALIDLVSPYQATEYWIGFENFYVITRYNRSSFYAMSVFQLAESLRKSKE